MFCAYSITESSYAVYDSVRLHPGAAAAFLAALVVPSHFPPLQQHLGLFNKEASGSSEAEKTRESEHSIVNYARVCELAPIKESMAYLKAPASCSNSPLPKQELNFACPRGNSVSAATAGLRKLAGRVLVQRSKLSVGSIKSQPEHKSFTSRRQPADFWSFNGLGA